MAEASEERTLWTGRPSQWVNAGPFLACLLILPIPWAFWRWLALRFTRYELTSERLRLVSGVLNRRTEELELYRVKDTSLEEPFLPRLFGLAHVVIRSSDPSHPVITLRAIPGGGELREKLRRSVEELRARRGVREVDVT
jgi:uncharacterized membrane protein YdbT with pleckstrin-like domain